MPDSDKLTLIGSIAASYLRRNSVSIDQIATVVSSVTRAIEQASREIGGSTVLELQPAPRETGGSPAVPIKKSVQREYIVCLEDGRRLKTLKRHLQRAYGLSPAQYRAKWGLPDSYPMVAPNYSVKRSVIAKSINLGHSRARAAAAEVATTVVVKARRARKQRVNILPGD